MKPNRTLSYVAMALLTLMIVGCLNDDSSRQPKADAVAVLMPTKGNAVDGIVRFAKVEKGLRIMARLNGLTPGLHGFHIHEFGDCRDADAASAGAHFNPDQAPHAGPHDAVRHLGDLGNVEADAAGRATFDMVVSKLTLDGPQGIIGRSVVVHADPDNLTSQPSGGAGARQACGVIGWAEP